jgi:hypothetical protein
MAVTAQRRPDLERHLCELCVFAPLREKKPLLQSRPILHKCFSQRRKDAKFAKLLFMGCSSYEWQGKAWIVNLRVLPTIPDGKALSPLFSDVSKISCGVPLKEPLCEKIFLLDMILINLTPSKWGYIRATGGSGSQSDLYQISFGLRSVAHIKRFTAFNPNLHRPQYTDRGCI